METNMIYGGCGHTRPSALPDWLAVDRMAELCPACYRAAQAKRFSTATCARCGGTLGYPYQEISDRDVCQRCYDQYLAECTVAAAKAPRLPTQTPGICRHCGDQLLTAAEKRRGTCGECAEEGVLEA